MCKVLIVAPTPDNTVAIDRLKALSGALNPLPPGVQELADNVWLADPAKAIEFVLGFKEEAAKHSVTGVTATAVTS